MANNETANSILILKYKNVSNSKKSYTFTVRNVQQTTNSTIKSSIGNNLLMVLMKHLRNIFIALITLLSINSVSVKNIPLNVQNKNQINESHQKFYHVSVDSFIKDTTPNEDFDLEEDTDDTDDDFLETMFSKNHSNVSKSFQNHYFSYKFSHQSVKRFILYCSLKLHC